MEERGIALFDMDGTLADYEGSMRMHLDRLRGPEEPVYSIHGDVPKHIENRMRLIKNSKDWWYNLPKLSLGFEILQIAQELNFEIHVLTKGPQKTYTAWNEKVRWCRKHLGTDVKVTITEDKALTYGKVLVDDYPEYMQSWLSHRPRGLGIMPANPSNANFSHPNVVHYDGTNSQAVIDLLKHVKNRKPREALNVVR